MGFSVKNLGIYFLNIKGWLLFFFYVAVPIGAAVMSFIEGFPWSYIIFLTMATLACSSATLYYIFKLWDYAVERFFIGFTPLTLARAEKLTFSEIAEKWAKELENEPGGWDSNKILHKLMRAMWLGEFEDNNGATELTVNSYRMRTASGKMYDENNNRIYEPNESAWNRHFLITALMPVPEDISIPSKEELIPNRLEDANWPELRDKIPWDDLAKVPPQEYDKMYLTVYIKQLKITKAEFKKWITRHKIRAPIFWFGEK